MAYNNPYYTDPTKNARNAWMARDDMSKISGGYSPSWSPFEDRYGRSQQWSQAPQQPNQNWLLGSHQLPDLISHVGQQSPQAQGIGINEGYQQLSSYAPPTSQEIGKKMKGLKKSLNGNNPWLAKAANGVGNVASGAGDIAGGIATAIETSRALNAPIDHFNDMTFTNAETEIGGIPSYSGVSQIGSEVRGIDSDAVTRGMGLTGFKGGASAGAAIGGGAGAIAGSFIPVLGNVAGGAIGAGVGAVAGGLTGWIKGMTKKGKADRAAAEAYKKGVAKHEAAQDDYNLTVEDYYEGVDAKRANMQSERNYQSRQYGLNQYNDPFRSII